MKLHRLKPCDQNSESLQQLAKKYYTTQGICGFLTCAICEYLFQKQSHNLILKKQEEFQQKQSLKKIISQINQKTLIPYVQKCMKFILQKRRQELKKYLSSMSQDQKTNYMKNYVCNYEIQDYLQQIQNNYPSVVQQQKSKLFFFRYCAYDLLKDAQKQLKFQQKLRVSQQDKLFKGEKIFYTKFNLHNKSKNEEKQHQNISVQHLKKQNFQQDLFQSIFQTQKALKLNKQNNKISQKPIIIAVDTGDHYNTVILINEDIYLLDTLTIVNQGHFFNEEVLEAITYYYKKVLQPKKSNY